jgi:hypothetical protein
MIEQGAGSPMEAWDPKFKGNATFSHPWAGSPAYLVYRGTLGIQALEPGYKRFEIRPQAGGLTRAEGVTPTVRGPITAAFGTADAGRMDLAVDVPASTSARVALPAPEGGEDTLYVDHKPRPATREGTALTVDLGSGCHVVSTHRTGQLQPSVLKAARGCDATPPVLTLP